MAGLSPRLCTAGCDGTPVQEMRRDAEKTNLQQAAQVGVGCFSPCATLILILVGFSTRHTSLINRRDSLGSDGPCVGAGKGACFGRATGQDLGQTTSFRLRSITVLTPLLRSKRVPCCQFCKSHASWRECPTIVSPLRAKSPPVRLSGAAPGEHILSGNCLQGAKSSRAQLKLVGWLGLGMQSPTPQLCAPQVLPTPDSPDPTQLGSQWSQRER